MDQGADVTSSSLRSQSAERNHLPGQYPEEEQASAGLPQGELGRSRALEEGAHFASYVILGLLGSGGLARVYRARHQTLGHEVALKVFEPAAAPGPSGVERFLREAHLAASIRHPHVVQTQDGGVHEGVPFLVLELLEGRDLEAHLRAERALEELALIELAIPIVAALMALHARGIIHGDLGPGNVFLVESLQVGSAQVGPQQAAAQQAGPARRAVPKLLDIGVSKPHRRLRLTAAARQRLMGSPLYMAPEAMLGHELTPASDQYSLGLILYECVTGVNPFIASSLKESVRLIIAGQRLAVLEQSIAPSPGLAVIIERALHVDPAERFPDLAALGRALLRLADHRTRAAWEFSFQAEPAAPAPPAAASRSVPTMRLRRTSGWGVPAVAVAALGWVTAGIVSFLSTRSDPDQAYVMLGPSPSTESLALRRAPAPPPAGATALAPCPDGAATTSYRAPYLELGTGAPVQAAAPGAIASATNAGEVGGGSLVLAGEAALEPVSGQQPAEPGAGLEADPAAAEQGLHLQLSGPEESREGASPLPARGTNNAPIFD